VVSAYRPVLDALAEDAGEDRVRECIRRGLEVLKGDFARPKTVFYFDGSAAADWLDPDRNGGTGIPLGRLLALKNSGEHRLGLVAPGPFLPIQGDSIRLHSADDREREPFKVGFTEDCPEGRWLSVPRGFREGDSVYLIRTRTLPLSYPSVVPGNTGNFRRRPGRDKAPEALRTARRSRGEPDPFPEGLYAAVSRLGDLYTLQAFRPVQVIVGYSRKIAAGIREAGKTLPFRPGEVIFSLDPFFPEAESASLAGETRRLVEMGYRRFIVNNPGHFSLFRGADMRETVLAAGPCLYVFNRWALSQAAAFGAAGFVSPLENNRQNLEKTVEPSLRSRFFVTVFAFPALFRIRSDLEGYGFGDFTDSRDAGFRLVKPDCPGEGARVYPANPFSIVDKIPFLEKAGFRRFILDFSGPPLRKKDYKTVMNAARNPAPLAGTLRFNWKNGFFSPEEAVTAGAR
jgi:putative protease